MSQIVCWEVLDFSSYKVRKKKKKKKKHPKKSNTKIFCLPPLALPSKFFVFALFLHFEEKTQPEHKEFRGLKAPNKGGFRHGIFW